MPTVSSSFFTLSPIFAHSNSEIFSFKLIIWILYLSTYEFISSRSFYLPKHLAFNSVISLVLPWISVKYWFFGPWKVSSTSSICLVSTSICWIIWAWSAAFYSLICCTSSSWPYFIEFMRSSFSFIYFCRSALVSLSSLTAWIMVWRSWPYSRFDALRSSISPSYWATKDSNWRWYASISSFG